MPVNTGAPLSTPSTPSRQHLILAEDGTARSDAVIAINDNMLELIAEGIKNHEFRSSQLDPRIKYLWLYVKMPVGAIT